MTSYSKCWISGIPLITRSESGDKVDTKSSIHSNVYLLISWWNLINVFIRVHINNARSKLIPRDEDIELNRCTNTSKVHLCFHLGNISSDTYIDKVRLKSYQATTTRTSSIVSGYFAKYKATRICFLNDSPFEVICTKESQVGSIVLVVALVGNGPIS